MSTQIASAAEQQSAVSSEISQNASEISQKSQETGQGAQQISAASEELAMSNALKSPTWNSESGNARRASEISAGEMS